VLVIFLFVSRKLVALAKVLAYGAESDTCSNQEIIIIR
jgi:hypothetical protein